MKSFLEQLNTLALRSENKKIVEDFWACLLVVVAMRLFITIEFLWYAGRKTFRAGWMVRLWWENYGRDWAITEVKPCVDALEKSVSWLLETALPYAKELGSKWMQWLVHPPAGVANSQASAARPHVIMMMDQLLGQA